jgi:hypothetical protein
VSAAGFVTHAQSGDYLRMRSEITTLVFVVVIIASAGCASAPSTRPSRETLVAVDGTAAFAASPERVRAAVASALRGIGYDVDDDASEPSVVRTRPHVEHVPRWSYIETQHPVAVAAAATAAAVVAHNTVPLGASLSDDGRPVDLDVAYTFTLTPSDEDPGTTVVVLEPHASGADGADVTERYLALVDTHRAWSAIFDGIDAELHVVDEAAQ